MIWSRYNEFVLGLDGQNSLFNCRTRKWITLELKLYNILKNNVNTVSEIERLHPSLYAVLIANKFIVENEETDISECISDLDAKLSAVDTLKITINPTLDCNLRCWYCYETHLNGSRMTSDTLELVEKFLKNTLESKAVSRFHLSFFGGEPLIEFDMVVLPLMKFVKEICEKLGVDLSIAFTTNGVLLSENILSQIKGITSNVSFQIPFDGDEIHHNLVKKFPNGRGTYDLVVQNTKNAVLHNFRVVVRCNATKDNIVSFKYVINEFKDYIGLPNMRFSFHKVWQEADDELFKSGIKNLKEDVFIESIQSNINTFFGDSINPCYGDYLHNYVINYNGDVFKCTARDFNSKERIGILNSKGDIDFNESALIRINKSLTTDCYSCRRLPFCPICTQVRSESTNGKCPINITPKEIAENIRQLYIDLSKNL